MTRTDESACRTVTPATAVASARLAPAEKSNAAGQNDQSLPNCGDGDDGRLRQDIANMDRLETV